VSAALAIWMNGERVGTWSVDRGSHRLSYDRTWLDSPRRRSLSLSLPITPSLEISGPVVAHYFDNLLPDSDRIRERIARRHRTKSTEVFELLQAVGRDCIGAVQLLPEDVEPQGWNVVAGEPLDEHQVAEVLRAAPSESVLGQVADDDLLRISLAGAQEKTALLFTDRGWHRPLGATPTTHILKLPLGLVGGSRRVDLSDSIENEWLCAQILYQLDLPVAPTELWRFEDQKALVITRFDRSWEAGPRGRQWIARLPQEDFCQALGHPPSRKYEKDGGPGIADCMRLLAGSADGTDRQTFALTQLAFWLMGATDGHAKNHSIFLQRGDTYITTPLYDVLSILPYVGDGANQFRWRKVGPAMALQSKNVHWHFHDIHARHWHGLAMRYGGAAVWEAMQGLVQRVGPALERIEGALPGDFPGRTWEAIARGMRAQAAAFSSGLAGVRQTA
jgi:serine/threonine-protein kinase HipA